MLNGILTIGARHDHHEHSTRRSTRHEREGPTRSGAANQARRHAARFRSERGRWSSAGRGSTTGRVRRLARWASSLEAACSRCRSGDEDSRPDDPSRDPQCIDRGGHSLSIRTASMTSRNAIKRQDGGALAGTGTPTITPATPLPHGPDGMPDVASSVISRSLR